MPRWFIADKIDFIPRFISNDFIKILENSHEFFNLTIFIHPLLAKKENLIFFNCVRIADIIDSSKV